MKVWRTEALENGVNFVRHPGSSALPIRRWYLHRLVQLMNHKSLLQMKANENWQIRSFFLYRTQILPWLFKIVYRLAKRIKWKKEQIKKKFHTGRKTNRLLTLKCGPHTLGKETYWHVRSCAVKLLCVISLHRFHYFLHSYKLTIFVTRYWS